MAKLTITLDFNGGKAERADGSAIPAALTYNTSSGNLFVTNRDGSHTFYAQGRVADNSNTLKATRYCYEFRGFFSQPSGGTKLVDRGTGKVNSAFFDLLDAANAEDTTLYAKWRRATYRVLLDKRDGTGGTDVLFAKVDGSGFAAHNDGSSAITGVTVPTRAGYTFTGYSMKDASDSSGYSSTRYIDSSGNITSSFVAGNVEGNLTLYARWTPFFHAVTVDPNGGSGGIAALYTKRGTGKGETWYSDPGCNLADVVFLLPGEALNMPTREGHSFNGLFASYTWTKNGTSQQVTNQKLFNADGTPVWNDSVNKSWLEAIYTNREYAANLTLTAQWTANTYTLAFSPGPEGNQQWSASSVSVTYGAAIGSVFPSPSPTSTRGRFLQWNIDNTLLTSTTRWKWASGKTATPVWSYYWGMLTDFFGLGASSGDCLFLVRSDSGATRTPVATTCLGTLAITTGNSSTGGYSRSEELANPTCTYRVKAAATIQFTLGKAYTHNGQSFMLVAVEYRTAADEEPTLTLRGVANEGADAINLWTVTLTVSPDHTAQDPQNAVQGGGELIECTTVASCEPVVVYEDGVPAASDVVRGKVAVTARTAAYQAESAPSASGGFLDVGRPKEESDVDFATYGFTAERSLA